MRKSLEVSKFHNQRIASGFYDKYMSGKGLDIGYKGLGLPGDVEPVLPTATGVDLDYPGYNGTRLPFPDESQDFVFASHTLEHIANYQAVIRDWFRVLKIEGHLVLMLPNMYLYEKSFYRPGKWPSCPDHKRQYTPGRLLREIEETLRPNTYRIVHMAEGVDPFDFTKGPTEPPRVYTDRWEIELVLKKVKPPQWEMAV